MAQEKSEPRYQTLHATDDIMEVRHILDCVNSEQVHVFLKDKRYHIGVFVDAAYTSDGFHLQDLAAQVITAVNFVGIVLCNQAKDREETIRIAASDDENARCEVRYQKGQR